MAIFTTILSTLYRRNIDVNDTLLNPLVTGDIIVSQLANGPVPVITNVGAAGVTNYSYKIVAKTTNGHDAVGAAGSTATGNVTLDGTNYNVITWAPITGALSYDIYRTVGGATQGKIGNVIYPTTSLNDTGLAGDAATAPATNNTGSYYSAAGSVNLGTTPGATAAINVDAATAAFATIAMRVVNATVDAQIIASNSNAQFGTISNHNVVLFANNNNKWNVVAEAGGTSTLSSANVTARFVGGSGNGLAIRNSGNTRDNFALNDAGGLATLNNGVTTGAMALIAASGEQRAGVILYSSTANHWAQLAANGSGAGTTGGAAIIYPNGTQYFSAVEVSSVAAGFGTLSLMKSGGDVTIGSTTPSTLGYAFSVYGNSANGVGFRLINQAASGIKNWLIGPSFGGASDTISWVPSTANDGVTFTTSVMSLSSVGALSLVSKLTTYNNIATNGLGVPAIYKVGRATAQAGANASVAAYTLPALDGSYEVSANVLVTTATTHNFTVTCAYTSEDNVARTLTFNFSSLAGVLATPIINTGGAVPYEGVPLHIRCKASTTITIATTGTFTTVAYNVEGIIKQTA